MATRSLLAASALVGSVLAAAPAFARSDTARLAETLGDRQTQTAVAAAVRTLSEAMLALRVAPFLDAAEVLRDPIDPRAVDPDTTLGEIAGPRARDIPEDLSRRLPVMMGAMGGMAQSVETMTPALKGMAREMGRAMGEAMNQVYRGPDQAPDPADDQDVPSAMEE